ncbi:MAG: hypothetical protein GY766_17490, partial [Herbaspirillum sp.]|uniref:hypothetical protein n=1 Tax=Herbaspirillum sp. TaxID=1890675 RepID=UPI0025893009
MNYPDIPGGFGYNPSAGAAGGMLHPLGMLGGVNYAPGSGGGFQMDAQGNIVDMAGNAPAPDGNGGIRYNTNGYNTNQPQGQFTDLTQAGLHAANQAYNLYGQGPQFAGFGDTSQQAHNQIKGLATGNQYLPQANQTVSNVMGGTNPYMQPYTPDVNPFLQGFSDFGANQNTAFNQTVDNAMNRVSDATNSQFGLSGRTGSGLHAGVMTERLGNAANQMYSDNFAGNQARNLQAMQSGANTYANTQARNLQEQGQGINAWQNQNTQKL